MVHLKWKYSGSKRARVVLFFVLCVVLFAVPAWLEPASALASGSGVTFREVAGPSTGLVWERTPSVRNNRIVQAQLDSLITPMTFDDVLGLPAQYRGLPGVALFDHDQDGDLDIYVTNGPGTPNSLFSNQRMETGLLTFVDVAAVAGVTATSQDSAGTCFADIDNDGDRDLFVVGHNEPHILYENQGNGTFVDISATAGLGNGGIGGTSCSFGDVDRDGFVDILVGHTWNQDVQFPCFEPFAFSEHNELFLNVGGNSFIDVSSTSGIENLGGYPPYAAGAAGNTWAVALVDYDFDGQIDYHSPDDQCGVLAEAVGGVDRGLLQLFDGDGAGLFTNVTVSAELDVMGSWLGVTYGDFDHDGYLDFFATNMGDWVAAFFDVPFIPGSYSSRWFLGGPGGTFTDSHAGSLFQTPYGWGTSAQDFDNDGDTDIVFLGGFEGIFVNDCSNPGTVLFNDGTGELTNAPNTLDTDHARRNSHGIATGDLNGDGFVDIVSASSADIPLSAPLLPYSSIGISFGSSFDASAFFVEIFDEVAPGQYVWNGTTFPNGSLSVEMNNGNDNGWVAVRTLGTVGITTGGEVNRDGIGAVVRVTPKHGKAAIKPIVSGSSHLSQDSLTATFGLGSKNRGDIEILWPGGVKNRLYSVKSGERITFPEIPCSFDDSSRTFSKYRRCVRKALDELEAAGALGHRERARFQASAFRAYRDR